MPVGHDARPAEARASVATRLSALADIARAAWAGSETDLLTQAGESARRALDAASVSISRWDRELGQVRTLLNLGELGPGEVPRPPDEVYPAATCTHLQAFVDQLVGWTANIDDDGPAAAGTDADRSLLREQAKHCCVGAPISLEGRIWGELYLTRTADQPCFDHADLDLALVVATQLGAALATSDHLARVERLAHTDPLTGLGNRRTVDEALEAAMARHRADGVDVALIVCDLNGLKRINDDQGHDAGDRALVRFSGMLAAVAEGLDGAIAARLGGDEFCIVVPDAVADDVVAAAERLCRQVLRSPLEGVSCGVACTADDVGSVETVGRLFRLADAAQYRAKRSRAGVPVVSGRGLPSGVLGHESAGHSASADRRLFRGRDLSETARLLRSGLDPLADARDRTVEDRLAQVAELVSEQVHPLAWWLSSVDVARGVVTTRRHAILRSPYQPGKEFGPGIGDEYLLSEYPQTAHAVRGHAVTVNVSDPEADAAELAMLDRMGAVSLLMAGVQDPSGTGWLLEFVADAMGGAGEDVGFVLQALMAVAALEGQPVACG